MSLNPYTLDDEKTIQPDFGLQTLTVGMTLCNGKYHLEEEAGKGGMGIVWKAWDATGERWVALKFLPPEIRNSEDALARLKASFKTIQALNHPNICPVYGLENDATFGCFVVMRWLDGQSLNNAELPKERIYPVLEKVADALDYAHGKRVIHRDVKPSNIMIAEDGEIYLVDFVIASNLNTETQATQRQYAKSGTEKYMVPEQKNGQRQTAQTDEYALAIVALELLAGQSPFACEDLPQSVKAVLRKATAENPENRYTTCRAFVDALGETLPKPVPVVETYPVLLGIILILVLYLICIFLSSPFDIEGTRLIRYSGLKVDIQSFIGWKTKLVIPKGVTEIGWYAFLGRSCLTSVVIGNHAFEGCSSLTSVVIPEGVTEIGEWVFYGCSSLTSVVIPEGVRKIEYCMLSGCSSLTSVVIPEGVTVIEDWAFWGCSSLTSVEIPESVTVIGYEVFAGCPNLTIHAPKGAYAEKYAKENNIPFEAQ